MNVTLRSRVRPAMPGIALGPGLAAILFSSVIIASVQASIVSVEPFTGSYSETWEGRLNHVTPDFHWEPNPTTIMGGGASMANPRMAIYENPSPDANHFIGPFGIRAQVSDGVKGLAVSGSNQTARITFATPVSEFGAYWASGTPSSGAVVTFFDEANAQIGLPQSFSYTRYSTDGGLDWHGWGSTDTGVKSVTFTGDFVAIDGLQANPANPMPELLTSAADGLWDEGGTWDDDDQTPTDADDAVVGSHTVTVTENAAANSVEITEAAGKLDAGAVLDLTEGLTMAAGSQLGIGLAGTAPGRIEADGDVSLDGELELRIDGSVPFSAGTYTLISTAEPNAIEGTLLCITDLDAYVSSNVDEGRDEFGLVYDGGAVTLTLDKHLNPGDANLDAVTDVRDFNKWNAAKFTNDTEWTTGDFNGDGITDVRDFNKWNAAKFTTAEEPGPLLVEGQVPEPSVLVLMSVGLLGLVVYGLRRKRLASILTPVSAAEGLLSIS